MTEEFGIQSKSEAHGPVLAATFNENIHEIVTVGTAFLTVCAQLKTYSRCRNYGIQMFCVFAELGVQIWRATSASEKDRRCWSAGSRPLQPDLPRRDDQSLTTSVRCLPHDHRGTLLLV